MNNNLHYSIWNSAFDDLSRLSSTPSGILVFLALFATSLVVAGSQLGVIYLSIVFAESGRSGQSVTPELILGMAAILVTIVLAAWHRSGFLLSRTSWLVLTPFCLFVFFCIASESLQAQINWRVIVTFCTLLGYLLLGGICGYCLGGERLKFTMMVVFQIFLLWYVGLILLAIFGFLSMDQILTGATLARLGGVSGFTATEFPIYIGMQLPLVLMVLFSPMKGMLRVLAYTLLICNTVLLVLSASVGAIVASVGVVFVFLLFGDRVTKMKATAFVLVGMLFVAIVGGFYLAELYFSVVVKIDRLQVGGGRSRTIALLVDTVLQHPWTGIGKSNFQYINNFRRDGTGYHPHQNILGIAAEMGIPAAVSYVIFNVTFLVVCLKAAVRLKSAQFPLRSSLLVAICGILIYQQARGMLHDTWTIKEMYFWLGFALGVVALPTWRIKHEIP